VRGARNHLRKLKIEADGDRPTWLPRNRSHRAAGYENLSYVVRIKGSGTTEQFAEIHKAVMAISTNFYNVSRPVTLKPTFVVE
jgi:hypothetical protein